MKRILAMPLAFLLAISCCLMMASAAETVLPRASITLSSYAATVKAGSSSGELRISYQVNSNMVASELGVSSIEIYKSNGTYIKTIYGSTTNGFIHTSSNAHTGTYSYTASPGTSYYAVETVFASTSAASDSRDVTTATVKAPDRISTRGK